MNELDYFHALCLGVLQGLTEFLPISSSGHLALAQRFAGLDPTSPPILLLDVLAHVGTVLAVAVVFRQPFLRFLSRLIREASGRVPPGRRTACRIVTLSIVSSICTAALGLGFKNTFESAFDKPTWIGVGLLGTGLLLLLSRFINRGRLGWRGFTSWHAMLVGVAQGIAIFPGVSRSGATICVALFCGLRRRWAGHFSFLIAVPAICGAAVLKALDIFGTQTMRSDAIPWGPLIVGTITSFAVGVASLRLLVVVIERARMHYFWMYCAVAGTIVLLTYG